MIEVLQCNENGNKDDTEMEDVDGAREFKKCAHYRESVLYIQADD